MSISGRALKIAVVVKKGRSLQEVDPSHYVPTNELPFRFLQESWCLCWFQYFVA
jgi:hypothetical protein